MTDLGGASFLVAGAAGGLGRALTAALEERGARLTLTSRTPERLAEVAGDRPHVAGDLSLPGIGQAAVAAAIDAHGRLDGIVDASGVVAFGPLAELDDDTLEELFVTNVFGPVRLVRAALPHLSGGVVVHLTGVVAERPTAHMAAYSASKAALRAIDDALALELRRQKVRFLSARPPHLETGLAERPLAGTAPRLPTGLDPAVAAERIVRAIVDDETDLPTSSFG
ncbi:MAG TPA: SDR family oxidoreductase [Acidimicrobiales bacterium]|nr:SDR family oxidoreductase [Acidimicrobiales bacterium]